MTAPSDQSSRAETILAALSPSERTNLLSDPEALATLEAFCRFSPVLSQAATARPDLARWLMGEKAYTRPSDPDRLNRNLALATRETTDPDELKHLLRRTRLWEISRLVVRDLTGRADLAEVTATLSHLADACLVRALDFAVNKTARRFEQPPDRLGIKPVILGMGKLGARELNYSSDVDLIYLFRPTLDFPGGPAPVSIAQLVFTEVTRAMSEVTRDGLVFRVDLDLRPGGKDGAQAQAVAQAARHYMVLGQAWERLALLKARPVAGDLSAGRDFLAETTPFVFRRHLDYTTIEELKALKERFVREPGLKSLYGSASGRTAPINVKLSHGGIREIEFFVQALTLTFGGRLPHLRVSQTLKALEALSGEGLISPEDARQLAEAYVFLRTVEHRIQIRDLAQTQTLPKDPITLGLVAASMGFDDLSTEPFLDALKTHMSRVHQRFQLLLADPEEKTEPRVSPDVHETLARKLKAALPDQAAAEKLLSAAGFQRPETAVAICRNILEGRFLPLSLIRYRNNLERLFPRLAAGAAKASDPDRAFLHLERFLTGIGPKAGFLILLEENPHIMDLLLILFGASDFLAEILVRHPSILDSLIDRRSAVPVKRKLDLDNELKVMLGSEGDFEARLAVIRRFKNDEILRIGMFDVLGKLNLPQIQSQLSGLAETVMAQTFSLTVKTLHPEWIGLRLPVVVMGLGKLGGRELAYGSDLDLIFVIDEEGPPGWGIETAVRLCQRFISYLSLYLEDGPGYEIDSRLRPSGGSGPLVVSREAFARYHETSQLWERQALLKMRPVLGPFALGAAVKAMAAEAIFHRPMPENAAERIDHLKSRMTLERGRIKNGTVNLKFSPGGLVEAEFLTQYLQMVHGKQRRGGLRATTTRTALKSLVRSGLGPAGLKEVESAYTLLSHLNLRLGLMYRRSGDRTAYLDEEIQAAKIAEGGSDPLADLAAAMARIQQVYSEVFGK